MAVGIVGAGAVGLFLAQTLSVTQPVTLYIKRNDQLKALQKHGIRGYGHPLDQKRDHPQIQFKSVDEVWAEPLIIVAVKQPALHSLFQTHSHPTEPDQALLFIQNGMGHLSWMEELEYRTIYAGIVEHGIRKENDTTIHWTGKGRIRCGVVKGKLDLLQPLLAQPVLNAEWASDFRQVMVDKLVVNAVINPLTALYGVTNGALFQNSHFSKTAFDLFGEIAEVLALTKAEKREKWAYIKGIAHATALNRSSMLQDLDQGKVTEIEAILGYILVKADHLGISQSLSLSHFIYESIKGLEAKNQNA